MGYKDEEIMAEKKAAALKKIQELEGKKLEAQLKESIYDECIHVDDKEIRFSQRTFTDLGISIYMPETFEPMEEEVKEAFYPLKNAPKYVFVDYEIPFQITLNQTKHKVPDVKIYGYFLKNYRKSGTESKSSRKRCCQNQRSQCWNSRSSHPCN